MDLFGTKKIAKRMDDLVMQNNNLMHLIKMMAGEFGIVLELHEASNGSAAIYFVRQKENPSQINVVPIRGPRK